MTFSRLAISAARSRFAGQAAKICILAAIACVAGVSASNAGTVTGTVRNGTTDKPAANVDVILIQLQGGMKPVANIKTDAQGHFKFEDPGLGAGPMLIRAVYRGVNYHEPATPGKTVVNIDVFEPTDKPGSFTVPAHAIILQPNGQELLVGEEYNIENKTKPPMAFYRADGSFLFSLPDGAQLSEVSAAGSSGMPVVQGTIDKGKNQEAIAFAFRPGDSGVRISYKLPYPGNETKLHFVSIYPAEKLAVFAPPSVKISGDGFAPAGQDQGFNVYMRESVAANTPLSVSVSGTAPMPATQGNGAVGGPPGSDQSQNPSVNSRLEQSGAESLTATATTMPARLDSLKWILVAGFVALFALGFVFLWRRPQVVTAGNGVAGAAISASMPHVPRASAQAVASAPVPVVPSAVAEVDSEIRGGLDALKDNLFRLELRRQAGTITEEDYTRERARMEKVLRDLVRG